MVEMNCPHCSEVIVLPSSEPGSYECPYCDKIFKVAKKQTKPQSIEMKQNLPQTNPANITIPNSTMAWHNSKLVVFTILGAYLVIQGIILFFDGFFWFDYNPIGAVFFFCGVYLLIPLIFAKQNIEDMEAEMEINALSPSSKKFKVNNRKKTAVKGILGTSIAVSTVVSIIVIFLVVVFFVVIMALLAGASLDILSQIFG